MKQKLLAWLGAGYVVSLLLNFVQLKKITGIPAHPLLLHTAVIFIPSLALAAVVFAIRADWRKRYGVAFAIGAIITNACTTLTANAGDAWVHMLDAHDRMAIHDHAELGDKLHAAVIVFAGLILIQVALDLGFPEGLSAHFANPRAGLAVALSILIGVVAVGVGVLTVLTGHAGAKAVFGPGGDRGGHGAPRFPGGGPRGSFSGQFYNHPPGTN